MKIVLTILTLAMGGVSLTGCPEVKKQNCEALKGKWDSAEQLCYLPDMLIPKMPPENDF